MQFVALLENMNKAPIVVVLCSIFLLESQCNDSGPIGSIKLEYYSKCEDFADHDDFSFEGELKDVDGSKVLNADFHLGIDIDDNMEFQLDVAKWKDGAWQNDVYNADGNFFENVKKYVPKVFDHLKKKVVPEIEGDDNLIPAGDYEIDGFEDIEDSLDFPQVFYGKFKLNCYLILDDEEVACVEIGLDSQSE